MSHDYSDRRHEPTDHLTDAERAAFESLGTPADAPSPDLEDRIVAALRARGLIGAADAEDPAHAGAPSATPPVEPIALPSRASGDLRARTWWRPVALAASIVTAFGLGIGVGRQSSPDAPVLAEVDTPPIVDAPVSAGGESPGSPVDGTSLALRDRAGEHVRDHDGMRRGRPAKGEPDVDAYQSENDFYALVVDDASSDAAPAPHDAGDDPFVDVDDPAGWSSWYGVATIVKGVQPTGEPRRIARP